MAEESRWWDKYYVRYFVGTVYAVPLLVGFAKDSAAFSVVAGWETSKWVDAAVLAAAGLAFCYLSSAPILLLHAIRVRIGKTKRAFYAVAASTGVLTLLALAVAVCKYFWGIDLLTMKRFALVPYLVIVGLGAIGLLACSLDALRSFYSNLAKRRKTAREAETEYVESYRHLREHGNALLIILMENVLALALWQATDVQGLVFLIVLWILPATSVWFLATWLERGLADGAVP